jgi:uncharacterized protein YecA (UPF0149 family)
MDTRDGRIYENLDSVEPEDHIYLKPMSHHPTPTQRATRRVGRNDVCPCGSGKKFKKCCLFRQRK